MLHGHVFLAPLQILMPGGLRYAETSANVMKNHHGAMGSVAQGAVLLDVLFLVEVASSSFLIVELGCR